MGCLYGIRPTEIQIPLPWNRGSVKPKMLWNHFWKPETMKTIFSHLPFETVERPCTLPLTVHFGSLVVDELRVDVVLSK